MSKQPQYTTLAREAFSQYLNSQIDLDVLIGRLRDMELQLMSDEEEEEDEVVTKSLWFRFFEGDPLQTTIPEIEKDLRNPDHPNCDILLRGIALGLHAEELEVHYS